jgi:hypothetical protein
MNREKAKDFFSAYHDGSIEPGLKQSLEQQLRSEPDLRDEYRAFEGTMRELNELRFEKIEIPFDLEETIAARLDRNQFERRRSLPPAWSLWVRNLALTGVAAAIVFGALTVMATDNQPDSIAAGIVAPPAADKLRVAQIEHGVELTYTASDRRTLVVRSGIDGDELGRFEIVRQSLKSPLENPHPVATLMSIRIDGEESAMLVALPGSLPEPEISGEGTVADFARSLAGFYRVPVVVEVADPTMPATWTFASTDAQEAAAQVLGATYSVEHRASGILHIFDR